MVDFEIKDCYKFDDLLRIMEILRAPDGCMWDREQDHHSIRRNFIEETYEVCEAIDDEDTEHMKEELGDVLLQVVFHTQMEKEKGTFDIDDVADGICKKLIFRHPHIFGNVEVASSEEVLRNWDDLKRKEKHQETDTQALESVAKSLPSLIRAEKLQQKNQKLIQSLDALQSSTGGGSDLSQQISDIKGQTQSYTDLLNSLKSGKKTIDGAVTSAADARSDLGDLSAKSQDSLQDVKQKLLEDLIPKLYRVLDDLASVNGSLSTALSGIEPLTEQGRTILKQLDAGLSASVKQLEQTGQSLVRVDESLEQIQTDLNALHSSETYQDLLTLEGIDSDRIADFMASPVSLESKVVYNVDNYGTGMTPFYTNLALWVGGLILVSILKQEVDPAGISRKRLDPTRAYFGRWLLFMAAGAIQGLIVCLGDLLLLGVQCVHPLLFVLEGIYCSFVYVNIIYALAITFKHIGKAVAVLLIILQIPGSSGTYPIEMMPEFFQKLYPLFPFSYGIDAMREAIAGFYGNLFVKDLLYLLVFVALSFFTGLVIRPLIMNLNHMFDRHLEKSELMLGEVPVSPEPNRKFYAVLKALLQHEESKMQLLEKSVQFERYYPKLIRWGFICMIVIPLLLLILMFSLESRLVFLVLWIVSLIVICGYLICVEYIHDKMHRQLEINGMTGEDLTKSIKEEKER